MLQILLVEDSLPLCRVLAVMLQRSGCHVTLARSACEALQALEQCAYDALLIDMDMAHQESRRLLQALATVPHPRAAVVLLSHESTAGVAPEGCDGSIVLGKPVSRDALLHGLSLAAQASGRQPAGGPPGQSLLFSK